MIRIGTRGSLLATTQSGVIRDQLIAAGHEAELVVITTAGDMSAEPVEKIGIGVFTTAIRNALHARDIDVAVHSYKDLPTAVDPVLTIAAVPPREDSRDALVASGGRVLGELLGEALREVVDRALRGRVVEAVGGRRVGLQRGRVDDGRAGLQVRERGPGDASASGRALQGSQCCL